MGLLLAAESCRSDPEFIKAERDFLEFIVMDNADLALIQHHRLGTSSRACNWLIDS